MSKLPSVISDKVKESGIAITKAEKIASGYTQFVLDAQEQANKLKVLQKGNKDDVAIAKRIRIDLGKICALAEKKKAEDKALILVETRFIDSLYGAVNGFARLTQEEAKEVETYFEKQEAERIAKIAEERCAKTAEYGMDGQSLNLGTMDDTTFDTFLNGLKLQFEAKQAAEAEAERKRIESEQKQQVFTDRKLKLAPYSFFYQSNVTIDTTDDEFNKMIADAEQAKLDHEKKEEAARLEAERLKKEAEEKAKVTKERNEKLAPYMQIIQNYQAVMDMTDELFEKELLFLKEAKEKKEKYIAEKRAEDERIKALMDVRSKELAPYISFIRDYTATINLPEEAYKKALSDLRQAAIDQANFEAQQKAKEPKADQLIEWINSAKISKPPFEDELTAEIIEKLSNWKQWAIKQVNLKSK
jgi:hypothetical protein